MARPRKRPSTELSEFLDTALKRRKLTQKAFCRLIGTKEASLSDIKLHRVPRTPTWAEIQRWAAVLDLDRKKAIHLYELVQLAHTPVYVQQLVDRLRSGNPHIRAADPEEDYDPEKSED